MMESSLKRLYVGGIGPSVSEKELTERFGKFGKVDDVDIISRKDEQGNAVKTFAYLNISISEADLKKCMSLLNKTKWKGGVLQIEMAKESFLHRLSQERQAAKEKKETPHAEPQNLVESLKEIGVTEFQMKAAVPGTEVPNHKNWVVSKYGRVLPVLHLKGSSQSKIVKYDPSKYCHNIKRLEDGSLEAVPVSQLTWHLDGGDDEISRKRRGEFPTPKNKVKKKSKVENDPDTKKLEERGPLNRGACQSSDRLIEGSPGGTQTKGFKKETNGLLVSKTRPRMANHESDSEEELKVLLEREKTTQKGYNQHAEDSNLEVVEDSFELSYTTHWGHPKQTPTKKGQTSCSKVTDDCEYDSADTDEIIAVAKSVQKEKGVYRETEDKPSVNAKQPHEPMKQKDTLSSVDIVCGEGRTTTKEAEEGETDSESVDQNSGSDSSDSYSDEEYKSMMQNCCRLNFSMEELEKLASTAKESSEDDAVDSEEEHEMESSEAQTLKCPGRKKTRIAPEEIVASIIEEEYNRDEQPELKRKNVPPVTLPAFKGLHMLGTSSFVESNTLLGKRIKNSMSDESDSEEELRVPLEREQNMHGGSSQDEDSNLEVVEDSFELSYTTHWDHKKETHTKKKTSSCSSKVKDDSEYDSADTDEIIAVAKTSQKDKDVTMVTEGKTSGRPQQPLNTIKQKHNLGSVDVGDQEDTPRETKGDKSMAEDSDSDNSDSGSVEKPKSMMQNRYRLDQNDLEKRLSTIKKTTKDDVMEGKPKGDQGKELVESKAETSALTQRKKTLIDPEDIVASILEDDHDSCDEKPKQRKRKVAPVTLPAFKGLGSLLDIAQTEKDKTSVSILSTKTLAHNTTEVTNMDKANAGALKKNTKDTGSASVGECSSGIALQCELQVPKQPKSLRPMENEVHSRKSSSSSDTSSDESSGDEESDDATSPATHQNNVKGTERRNPSEHPRSKQLEDNQKRLAAMEERRKERELQKKTIQGALLKQDSQPSNKGRHIVFDSEEESEEEEEVQSSIVKAEKVIATTKLFESSEEESNDEQKDDQERFQVKAQYEGRSGEKLMYLQSRFGTDERFKMDSRFLDNSGEDEADEEPPQEEQVKEDADLSTEKRRNLSILQSLLNIKVESQPLSKQAVRAKKFKDLNALQYDPTRDDHATFEAKSEEEKKESKSERKKKRLEAEKLPEVSTETYHEVTVDLKEVFGTSKPESRSEGAGTAWDQQEEPEKLEEDVEEESSVTQQEFNFQKKEESVGFTFSFFGATEEESVFDEDLYKMETIQPAKVAWQEDPRFQDSSSESEEEEIAMTEEPEASRQSEPAKKRGRFFFFVKDDERLKVGPKMFFCSSNLEAEQEDWEQRRELLLEECRKKHKDAKRKIKSKH